MALEFEIEIPEGTQDGTPILVLLHGRGADRFDLMGLGPRLRPGAIVIAPQAPFPAAPWGYGPGWAWYRYLGEDRPEPESFERSHELLAGFLETIPSVVPVRPGPIALGGFSQGGTMSLAHALLAPTAPRIVLNFSGFLARHPRVGVTAETVTGVRIFWGHGTSDPAIPFSMARSGRAALREVGADLTAMDYSIGHWIDPGETADAGAWLDEVL